MAKIKTVEDLLRQGDSKLNGTVTLLPIPEGMSTIEEDILTVDCTFPIKTPYIEFPNVPIIVMAFSTKNDSGDLITVVSHGAVRGTSVNFGLPINAINKLSVVMVGYSDGQLGGFTKPFYHDRTRRSFYYYDTSLFDTDRYDYVVFGEKRFALKSIVKYEKSQVDRLKYGNSAKYGDGHTYGGAY